MSALDDFTVYLAQAHGVKALPLFHFPCSKLRDDGRVIDTLRHAAQAAPAAIVIAETAGSAARPGDFRALLAAAALPVAFCGRAPDAANNLVAVLDRSAVVDMAQQPPSGFRVLAIVPTYNEADIVAQTLRYLIAQGIDVCLLDNWSTDCTIQRAQSFLGRGLVRIERFPSRAPSQTYDLSDILARVEEIAGDSAWASWVMLHDADERRRSPWPGVTLREALWRVDGSGYSCVDHVTLNFWPTDNSFDPERADLEEHFRHFDFSDHPGHFHQRRAWKRLDCRVELAANAGHDVTFAGRKVYPYKFLLKHYPVRSQQHGMRKIMRERVPRWNAQERAHGWHRQYDEGAMRFLRDARTLLTFDAGFGETYAVQALSGAGVFKTPPAWSTPPKW